MIRRTSSNKTLGIVAGLAGATLVSVTAFAVPVVVPVDQARTYCYTDPLWRTSNTDPATDTITTSNLYGGTNTGRPLNSIRHEDFDAAELPPIAGIAGGSELVWRVIGALPQDDPSGEAYCGYMQQAPIAISTVTTAHQIQDCSGVVRFSGITPPVGGAPSGGAPSASAPLAYTSATLHWEGCSVGGFRHSIAVSLCERADFNNPPDAEGAPGTGANPDCIIDSPNFGPSNFTIIHDVQNRRADNNPEFIVGGVNGIDRLNTFPVEDIPLNDVALKAINDAAGGNGAINFILRCADTHGHAYGAFGGRDNALVIHDPSGDGFGCSGDLTLVLDSAPQ